MSVIIRLQNLPWSANAADIRGFFEGLLIPEGGVHIVGGEQGDAFIAFGSDEDARLAMRKTNGILKGIQVVLLLSSRSEMQKVIETARQQAMSQYSEVNSAVQSAPAAAAPAPPAYVAPTPPAFTLAPPVTPVHLQSMSQAPPQMQQYGVNGAYYPAANPYSKVSVPQFPDMPIATAPGQASQQWQNGYGPKPADEFQRQAYVNAPPPQTLELTNSGPVNPYAMAAQQPKQVATEEMDEKELYMLAVTAGKATDADKKASSVSEAKPRSTTSSSSAPSKSSSSNNQSPRRSESTSDRRDKDKSRQLDKFGREVRDSDRDSSRRRRSKTRSRSRSRDRDRRRRHRSRSRSRDRSSRRRRSRSRDRSSRDSNRDSNRDKSRSSGGRDRFDRRTSDDKSHETGANSVPVAPRAPVSVTNSGATLPGLGEIPGELPRSLPNSILGAPSTQEIITSDMHDPPVTMMTGASRMEQNWGMDSKKKVAPTNPTFGFERPPIQVPKTEGPPLARDPRMQSSSTLQQPGITMPSIPQTDSWGLPIANIPGNIPAAVMRPETSRPPSDTLDRALAPGNIVGSWDHPKFQDERGLPPMGRPDDVRNPRARNAHELDLRDELNSDRPASFRDGRPNIRMDSAEMDSAGAPVRDPRGPRGPESEFIDRPGRGPPPRNSPSLDGWNGNDARPHVPQQGRDRFPAEPPGGRFLREEPREEYSSRFHAGPNEFGYSHERDSSGAEDPYFEGSYDSRGRGGMRGRGAVDGRGAMRGRRRGGFGSRFEEERFHPDGNVSRNFSPVPPFHGERFEEESRMSPRPGSFRGRGTAAPRGREDRRDFPPNGAEHPSSCSIEMLNLPKSASYRVIRDLLYYGLYVPRDSIKLLGDENGERIGVGLLRFTCEADAQKALTRDGMYVFDNPIQIRLIDEEIYDKHEDVRVIRNRMHYESRPVEFMPTDWIQIIGMPIGKTEDNVAAMFPNAYVNDIVREVFPKSFKATGNFYVRLSCPDEAHSLVIESQGMEVEGNVLELRQAFFKEVEFRTVPPAERHRILPADPVVPEGGNHWNPDMPPQRPGNGEPATRYPERKIALLPKPTSSAPADFPRNIETANEPPKRPIVDVDGAGEGTNKRPAPSSDLLTDSVVIYDVQMGTTHDNVAQFFGEIGVPIEHVHFVPYNPKLGGRIFVIFPKVADAKKALKQSGKPLGPAPVRIELIAKPEVMSAMGLKFNPLELIKKNVGGPSEKEHVDPAAARPNQSALQETPTDDATNETVVSKHGEVKPEQFGQPGCVVALSNLPFNASTEDIISYLNRDFPNISPENVIRRYNEHNLPTSDARVAFHSAADAQKALHILQNKMIFNRVIYLSLVE